MKMDEVVPNQIILVSKFRNGIVSIGEGADVLSSNLS